MSFAPFPAKNLHLSIGEEFCTFPCQKFAPQSLPSWMVLSSHFLLPKTLHSLKQFAFFVLLLSNGVTGDRSTETNERISGCTVLLLIEKWIKLSLIPNIIGSRKRDCAWGCARGINTTWENRQIEKHKSGRRSFRSPDWSVLFDLPIFSGGVYPPSATSRTISFSNSNSFWYTTYTSEQLWWHIWSTFPLNFLCSFSENASLLLLYHGAKKVKMTKKSNQGGSNVEKKKVVENIRLTLGRIRVEVNHKGLSVATYWLSWEISWRKCVLQCFILTLHDMYVQTTPASQERLRWTFAAHREHR